MELQLQDSATTVSDQALASKMVRSSRLSSGQRVQVLFNAGGVYDADRIETVLKVSFPKIQDMERRTGQVVPRSARPGVRVVSRHGQAFGRKQQGAGRFLKRVYEADLCEEEEYGNDETAEVFHLDQKMRTRTTERMRSRRTKERTNTRKNVSK